MRKMRFASICLLAAFPALGTTITSTTQGGGTWNANVQSGTSTDVSFYSGGSWNGTTYSDGGYIFTGPDGASTSLSLASFPHPWGNGLLGAQDGVGGIEITLPGVGNSAVYLSVVAVENNNVSSGTPLTATLSDGEKFTFSGGSFWFSSSQAMTSVLITPANGDNSDVGVYLESPFTVATSDLPPGNQAQTPEAATLALVGGGMLIVFGAKRKFNNKFAF